VYYAGSDVSAEFDGKPHSTTAHSMLDRFCLAELEVCVCCSTG